MLITIPKTLNSANFQQQQQQQQQKNEWKHLVNTCKLVSNGNINTVYFYLTKSAVCFKSVTRQNLGFMIT